VILENAPNATPSARAYRGAVTRATLGLNVVMSPNTSPTIIPPKTASIARCLYRIDIHAQVPEATISANSTKAARADPPAVIT
jgi:hypothetical protein